MKTIWNNWLKWAVFLYCALYTVATISNSVLYLINGHYEDPNGNWHELDRAIIVFIIVIAYTLIKHLKIKKYLLKAIVVYIPTLFLTMVYVWITGLREPLAKSAFRDIFINYTIGFVSATLIGWISTCIRHRSSDKK